MKYHFHKRFNIDTNYKLCKVSKAKPKAEPQHIKGQGQLKNIVHIFNAIHRIHHIFAVYALYIVDVIVMWSVFIHIYFFFLSYVSSSNIKYSIDIYLRLIISYYSFISDSLTWCFCCCPCTSRSFHEFLRLIYSSCIVFCRLWFLLSLSHTSLINKIQTENKIKSKNCFKYQLSHLIVIVSIELAKYESSIDF